MDEQEVTTYTIAGRDYPRTRYGDECYKMRDFHISSTTGATQPCGDCAVPVGAFHYPGCDVEECPRCGGQSISCGCDDLSESEAEATKVFWQEFRQ